MPCLFKIVLYSSKEINKDKDKKKAGDVTGKFVKQKVSLGFQRRWAKTVYILRGLDGRGHF